MVAVLRRMTRPATGFTVLCRELDVGGRIVGLVCWAGMPGAAPAPRRQGRRRGFGFDGCPLAARCFGRQPLPVAGDRLPDWSLLLRRERRGRWRGSNNGSGCGGGGAS